VAALFPGVGIAILLVWYVKSRCEPRSPSGAKLRLPGASPQTLPMLSSAFVSDSPEAFAGERAPCTMTFTLAAPH
jgi:hypothetical protein